MKYQFLRDVTVEGVLHKGGEIIEAADVPAGSLDSLLASWLVPYVPPPEPPPPPETPPPAPAPEPAAPEPAKVEPVKPVPAKETPAAHPPKRKGK